MSPLLPIEYESCKEIYDKNPGSVSGVYKLKSGKHHCVMGNATGCGGGGWTMAMKINGSKVGFIQITKYSNIFKIFSFSYMVGGQDLYMFVKPYNLLLINA